MTRTFYLLRRLLLTALVARRRDQRGDVPGWVLVTVMTAGLVGALYALAKPQLSAMLSTALNSVH
ncbi:MAG: hypothetical protein QM747_03165 [Nocardioides sp.]